MIKRFFAFFLIVALLTGCGAEGGTATSSPQTCTHADTNCDGKCDFCYISVMTTVDLYSINDLHGKVADGENHPGVDELTTYLKDARKTDDNVILLSAGDMWQGSSESNLTHGMLMTDWMNQVGFTAMALGNHEYDWGETYIAENAQFAQFPFLAINIYDRDTDALADYCQPSVVYEADGIQIGIIGAIGDCYSSISSDKVEDVYFKTGSELTALVKAESKRLQEQGVDFIVYCLHDGFGSSNSTSSGVISDSRLRSYYDISLSDGYVDLVFEGHTHQRYVLMDSYGVYHLQNRGDNRGGISHVELSFNTVTGDFSVDVRELVSTDSYISLPDDLIVEELLDKYKEQLAPGNRVLGTNAIRRRSDMLRQLVAEQYYQLGLQAWGDTYEITLGGGFISIRSPYELPAGDVKYAQLQSLFPFDNDLVLCSIKGSDLLSKFINTGNSNYYISGDQALMRNIDPNGTYYVVVDTYTSSYAPNRLTVVDTYTTGIYARDLLAAFIESGGLA